METLAARRASFQQGAMRMGWHMLGYLKAHRQDYAALEKKRDRILQAMDSCHRHTNAWQIVVDCALGLHEYMERNGDWETWI